MKLFKYWVTFIMDYEHKGISIPEREIGRTFSVRVISNEELSEKDALAWALQKWIASYDTKCYNDPRRKDKIPGDISIYNLELMGIQKQEEDSPYSTMLEAILSNPNDFRGRI